MSNVLIINICVIEYEPDSSDEISDFNSTTDEDIDNVNIEDQVEEDNNEEEEKEEEEEDDDDNDDEEEDDVVAAFISASSEKNRNHPPNLSVGNYQIGGLSFHPTTNVIALGLSNGDIAMYVYFFFNCVFPTLTTVNICVICISYLNIIPIE